MGIARRHDDRRRHFGAVRADHAADRLSIAGQVGNFGVEEQFSARSLECPAQANGAMPANGNLTLLARLAKLLRIE